MRIALQIVSLIALGVVVLPSIVYYSGNMELDSVKWLLLVATIVWFVVTPFWMGKNTKS